MRRLIVMAAVIAAAALLIAPVAAADSPSFSSGGNTYRVGVAKDFDTLNPLSTASTLSFALLYDEYDFLTRYTTDYVVAPQLATKWKVSPDGKTWTFTIRSGVKWSDGAALTAPDIVFTYDLVLRSQNPNFIGYLQYVTKVDSPDDATVVITTSRPSVRMLNLLIPILPEHIWGRLSDRRLETLKNVPLVSSGPFQVQGASRGHTVVARANPHYWGGRPSVDEVRYFVYKSSKSMVKDYAKGGLDAVLEPDAGSVPDLKAVAGTTVTTKPGFSWNGIAFNCLSAGLWKHNLLADKTIRQAVSWAIDKDAIAQACTAGLAKGATTVVPDWSSWHWTPPAGSLMTFDPAKATALLDAAGYVDRNHDGVRESNSGRPLAFGFAAPTDFAYGRTEARLVARYLSKVGIKIKVALMPQSALIRKMYNGSLDMYSIGWYGEPDPAFILSVVTVGSSGGLNDTGFVDPEYDRVFTKQISALDPTKRAALVDQLQRIAYEQAPYIPVWYDPEVQAWRSDRFHGWVQAPPGGAMDFNYLYDTYVKLAPGAAAAPEAGGSGGTVAIVGGVIAAVLVVGIAVVLLRRRRAPAAS